MAQALIAPFSPQALKEEDLSIEGYTSVHRLYAKVLEHVHVNSNTSSPGLLVLEKDELGICRPPFDRPADVCLLA
jgi:hypothetical protein